jgi:hypothetical protein
MGTKFSLTVAVGRTTRRVMGNQAAGRANYNPLRRGRGGAAWMPPYTGKEPSIPYERMMEGFATVGSKPFLLSSKRGKPRGEGEGQ